MEKEQEPNKPSPLSAQRKQRMRLNAEGAQFRVISEDVDGVKVRKLRGYAILFEVLGTPWRGSPWQEKVSKTALDGVDFKSVPVLWDHQTAWVLGREGKNARLEVDATGLFVEVLLGNTWLDDYVYDRVERELVEGMSFYFDSDASIATDWENKIDIITKINAIYEVSVLAFPAYEATVVIADEIAAEQESEEDPEEAAKKAALINLIEQL